ncbi:GH13933 [Drosophila grimshawi]|uniref:GH13933 n=1 Tax=Drosophila grimshawi TaxID=7222 RepID=B4K1J8_DROGR|nr:GH13933 [Drosophila grimshawi]
MRPIGQLITDLPEGKRAIGCKWVSGVKIGENGYEERNALTKRVAELTERISSVEKELFPLQCGNKELTSKIEELNVETIKWRQRANTLVEKSNRNPEEFKHLQAERERLAKLLTTEKEVNKKQLDELTSLKSCLENEIPALNRNLQMSDVLTKNLQRQNVKCIYEMNCY